MRPEGAVRGDHARGRAEKRLPRAARPSCEQHRGYAVSMYGGRQVSAGTAYRIGTVTGTLGVGSAAASAPTYADLPNRSPWVAQLAPDGPPRPLESDGAADVVVVGAGIAGIATAFFLLRSSTGVVMLLERDRVARGASGYNAGQLTTYFERPLSDIADEFGLEPAAEAQRDV